MCVCHSCMAPSSSFEWNKEVLDVTREQMVFFSSFRCRWGFQLALWLWPFDLETMIQSFHTTLQLLFYSSTVSFLQQNSVNQLAIPMILLSSKQCELLSCWNALLTFHGHLSCNEIRPLDTHVAEQFKARTVAASTPASTTDAAGAARGRWEVTGTFCMASLCTAVGMLPLACRRRSRLATDASPAFWNNPKQRKTSVSETQHF